MRRHRSTCMNLSAIAVAVTVRLFVVALSSATVQDSPSTPPPTTTRWTMPPAAADSTVVSEFKKQSGIDRPARYVTVSSNWHQSQITPRTNQAATTTLASPSSAPMHQLYLATGLPGRLICPVEDDPPNTLIMWLKDGRPVEARPYQQHSTRGHRLSGTRRQQSRHRRRRRREVGDEPGRAAAAEHRGNDAARVRESLQPPRVKIGRGGVLLFQSPERSSDEGIYTCLPYSPLAKGWESNPVHVLVRDPPYFELTPKPFYHRQPMNTVHMPCVAQGDPTPTVTWRRAKGGEFPSDSRTLQVGGNLTIARLTTDDQGLYECVASNVIADVITTSFIIIEQSTLTVELYHQIRPKYVTSRHPAYSVTVTTTHISAHLSWFPAYDTGFNQQYVIWYAPLVSQKTTGNETWHTLDVPAVDVTNAVLFDLDPGTTYRIVVQSRSCCGGSTSESHEAQYSDVVVTRTQRFSSIDADKLNGSRKEALPTRSHEHTDKIPRNERRRPGRPENVTVLQLADGGLLVSWLNPLSHTDWPPTMSTWGAAVNTSPVALSAVPAAVAYYIVEYRTVGPWVPLSGPVSQGTQFRWTTASRGATYHFRVRGYASDREPGEPSDVITHNTGDPMADVNVMSDEAAGPLTAGLTFLAILLAAMIGLLRLLWRRRRARGRRRQADKNQHQQRHRLDTVRFAGSSGRYGDVEVTHMKSPILERRRNDVTHPVEQPPENAVATGTTSSNTGNGQTLNNGGSLKELAHYGVTRCTNCDSLKRTKTCINSSPTSKYEHVRELKSHV